MFILVAWLVVVGVYPTIMSRLVTTGMQPLAATLAGGM